MRRLFWLCLFSCLTVAGCENRHPNPVTFYPPASEIFAGETGQLVNPDDERVPVLLGRSIRDYTRGWMAYVAGRTDLVRPLQDQKKIRWVKARTPVRVIQTEDRMGQIFLLVREGKQPGGSANLLERPGGWWTDARSFQITVGPKTGSRE